MYYHGHLNNIEVAAIKMPLLETEEGHLEAAKYSFHLHVEEDRSEFRL